MLWDVQIRNPGGLEERGSTWTERREWRRQRGMRILQVREPFLTIKLFVEGWADIGYRKVSYRHPFPYLYWFRRSFLSHCYLSPHSWDDATLGVPSSIFWSWAQGVVTWWNGLLHLHEQLLKIRWASQFSLFTGNFSGPPQESLLIFQPKHESFLILWL